MENISFMPGTNGESTGLALGGASGASGSHSGAYSSPIVGSTGFVSLRSLESLIVSRYLFASQYGLNTQFAGKRNLNLILGYDEYVDIEMYRYEYERGGISKRIVEMFPQETWANRFDVVENPNLKRQTAFERGVDQLKKRLDLHQRLIRASILAYLGRYSVILIGAPGDPTTELPRGFSPDNIAYLLPLGEDKVKIESIVGAIPGEDQEAALKDPRYGMPMYYQINLGRVSRRAEINVPSLSFSRRVHWSRVIHCVRAPLDNDIVCDPILKSVWNLLHDLKKLTGGLSEAALRRGWPGLHANVDKDAKFTGGAESPELKSLKSQLEEYMYGMLNGITTRGVNLGEISTKGGITLKDNTEAILEQIAITLGVPMNWLRGSELGLRSSEENKETTNNRIMQERAGHNTPLLRQIFKRFYDYGYLPKPRNEDYEIEWPEEEELSEKEKAETAKAYIDSGAMTVDEVRDQILGLEPMPKEEKEEKKEDKGEEIESKDEHGGLTAY